MADITTPQIEAYVAAHTTPHGPGLEALWNETHETLEAPGMLTGPVEGRFLQMLVFALRARRVLEIGTYSGYSALSMAAGMPDGGSIVTCEVSERHAEVARRHIEQSPYASMIDVRVGPALETLSALAAEEVAPFDFVFVDADKEHYPDYYDAVLPLLAPGGLIAADNTLWSGRVVEPPDETDDAATAALRVFNDRVAADPRVVCVQLTVRDGVTLIRHADGP